MNKSNIYDINGMDNAQIIGIIKQIVDTHSGCGALRVIKAKANRPLVDAIMRLTSFLDNEDFSFVSLSTRIYLIATDKTSINDFPHCIHCGKIIKVNVKSVHKGFPYEACSMKCAARSEQRKNKIESTNLRLHGKRKWNNGEKISESLKNMDPKKREQATKKFKSTRQRHIDENPNYWQERDQKGKQTKQQKYGDPNYNNRKQISTTKNEHAINDPMYYEMQMKKGKQTKKELYGDENYNNREKSAWTKQQKYGDPNYNNREKAANTCIDRYGVDNAAKNDAVKEQTKETCLDRYGETCYTKTKEFKIQYEQTCLSRYGVKSYSQCEKAKKENSLRINTKYYSKISDPSNEVEPLFTLEEYCAKTPLTEFKWRCKKCGSIFISPVTFIWARNGGQFARCIKCHPLSIGKSQKQRDVFEFLKNSSCHTFISEDRTKIQPYELDILDETLSIGVEFDGIYWHSAYGGETRNQLLFKTNLCNQNGIQLIHIFEDEWDKRKKQCKAKLKQMLSIDEKTIDNMAIQQIDKETSQDFLNANSHDLFSQASQCNYGLFLNKKLMSIMSWSMFQHKILINEFCNIASINIKNSFRQFMNFIENEFTVNHAIDSIQMNIDNRWPYDDELKKNGFALMKKTAPSKWLIDYNVSWSRKCKGVDSNTLKDYRWNESMQMTKFMVENHLTYITDCGTSIYVKQIKHSSKD